MEGDFTRLNANKMLIRDETGDYEPLCGFTDFTDVTTTMDEADEAPEKTLTPGLNNQVTMSFKCATRLRITRADKRRLLGWRMCIPTRNTRRRQIMRALCIQCGPLPKLYERILRRLQSQRR